MKKILIQIHGSYVPKYLNWKLSNFPKFLFSSIFFLGVDQELLQVVLYSQNKDSQTSGKYIFEIFTYFVIRKFVNRGGGLFVIKPARDIKTTSVFVGSIGGLIKIMFIVHLISESTLAECWIG